MRATQARGMTMLSIATRLSQKQFHQHLVKLDGRKGFRLVEANEDPSLGTSVNAQYSDAVAAAAASSSVAPPPPLEAAGHVPPFDGVAKA